MSIERSRCNTTQPTWFKSSYSGGEGGACVEVAGLPGGVCVRDSKDRQGPQLAFSGEAWAQFIAFAAAM